MESKASATTTTTVTTTMSAVKDDEDGVSSDSGEISDGEIFGSDEDEGLEDEPQQPRLALNFMCQSQWYSGSGGHHEAASNSSEAAEVGFKEKQPFGGDKTEFLEPDATASNFRRSSSTASNHVDKDPLKTSVSYGISKPNFYTQYVNPFHVAPKHEHLFDPGPNVEVDYSHGYFSISDDSDQASSQFKESHNCSRSNVVKSFPKPSESASRLKTMLSAETDPFQGYFNSGSKSSWSDLDRSINPFHLADLGGSSLLGSPPEACPVFEASTPNDRQGQTRKFIYFNPAKLASMLGPDSPLKTQTQSTDPEKVKTLDVGSNLSH